MPDQNRPVLGHEGIGMAILEAIGMKGLTEVRRIVIDLPAADVVTVTIERNADRESIEAVTEVLKGDRWNV